MRPLILHVGMSKTGTTSLQTTLFSSPPVKEFRFISLDTDFGNQLFEFVFRDSSDDPSRIFRQRIPPQRRPSLGEYYRNYLDTTLRACANAQSTPVLSAEII
ncbi:MAG: hypothetical protein ACKO3T_27350 [Planctomycetaceae bacterium]